MPDLPLIDRTARLEQALALSPRFYDAALEPAKWSAVLRDLRAVFDAQVIQLNLARGSRIALLAQFSDGMTKEQQTAYLRFEGHATADPRTPKLLTLPYRPFHCRMIVDDADWYASPMYRELHARWGFDYTLMYTTPWEEKDLFAVLGITRLHDRGPFTQDDCEHLSYYAPHLRRAVEVTMTLLAEKETARAMLRAFDHVEAGVLIVDRFARPVHVNPAARRLLDQNDGLALIGGTVHASDSTASRDLRAAVLDTGVAAMAGRPVPPVSLTLPRPDGGPALYVSVASLAGEAGAGLSTESALVGVFITDPARPFESDTERLQRLFGLTVTEALVLDALTRTGSARRVAEETGRGYETVRKHIKTIRDKVGAATQTDLVRMATQAR
jgi:DNA-binding CsgD family transcriptional regulator/PAS domain-containing protein